MDIHQDEMSLIALEYKQICGNDDRKSRSRMNQIYTRIRNQFIGVLKNKQKGIPLGDQGMVESQFDDAILYALTKWKGKSPFGGYLSVCFKGIITRYCKELSPVNRSECTKRVSYDKIIDKILDYEDNLDYDEAGLYTEDDMVDIGGFREEEEEIVSDYSDLDDAFEKWKLD